METHAKEFDRNLRVRKRSFDYLKGRRLVKKKKKVRYVLLSHWGINKKADVLWQTVQWSNLKQSWKISWWKPKHRKKMTLRQHFSGNESPSYSSYGSKVTSADFSVLKKNYWLNADVFVISKQLQRFSVKLVDKVWRKKASVCRCCLNVFVIKLFTRTKSSSGSRVKVWIDRGDRHEQKHALL